MVIGKGVVFQTRNLVVAITFVPICRASVMLFFSGTIRVTSFHPMPMCTYENENRHLTDTGVDVENKQVWASDGFKNGHPTEMGTSHTMGLFVVKSAGAYP